MIATTTETLSTQRDLGKHLNYLHRLCHSFQRRNGGDYEELLEEASLAYVEARNNFNPEKGVKFISYLHWIVWGRLKDWKRRRDSENKRLEIKDFQDSYIPDRVNRIEVIERECSADARVAMMIALNPPLDVVAIARRGRGETSPYSMRNAIKEHLTELGWAMSRIWQAFGEIQEALS